MLPSHISFHLNGPLDDLLETQEARLVERGYNICVEEMKTKGQSDEEVASELVKKWLNQHQYPLKEGTNIKFLTDVDATSLGQDKLLPSYWEPYYKENPSYTEGFWSKLFEEEDLEYRNQAISTIIPDDPIHRFVLHFLRSWRERLHRYILDEEISEEERVAVLRKQVENFAFFSRKKPFGLQWKMYSETNDFLQQALDAEGVEKPLHDSEGKPLRSITGQQVEVRADINIPKSAAAGPKPDENDKKIYRFIQKFATKKVGQDKVHRSWTMVKSSFLHKSENTSVTHRYYAFSGHAQSEKELHDMPSQWWEASGRQDGWEDDQKIEITNVDRSQFGHNLVLILFNALRPFVEEDFRKLARHLAFEELAEAGSLIIRSRRDMGVLDYGEFYDLTIAVVNDYDKKISKAVFGVLKSDLKPIEPYVHVCCKNKQFAPNKDKIGELLSKRLSSTNIDSLLKRICKISERLLKELETKLDELPNKFLTRLFKHLEESKCGEDNVIGLTLRELLSLNFNSFLKVKVQFVAMDADSFTDGKPFCGVCAKKVPFYSVLPQLLREIGSTGHDFEKLSPLFEKLKLM